jgi:hypothetical protein
MLDLLVLSGFARIRGTKAANTLAWRSYGEAGTGLRRDVRAAAEYITHEFGRNFAV